MFKTCVLTLILRTFISPFAQPNLTNIDTKNLEVDTDHKARIELDNVLGGDLSRGLRDILPKGYSEDDVQVILVKPKEKDSAATFLIFVDTTQFVAFASLGSE